MQVAVYLVLLAVFTLLAWMRFASREEKVKCDCNETLVKYLVGKVVPGFHCPTCRKEYISSKYSEPCDHGLHKKIKDTFYIIRTSETENRPKINYSECTMENNRAVVQLGDHIKWKNSGTFHGIVVSISQSGGLIYVIKFSLDPSKNVQATFTNLDASEINLQYASYGDTKAEEDDPLMVVGRAYAVNNRTVVIGHLGRNKDALENVAIFCKFGFQIAFGGKGKTSMFGSFVK